MSSSTVSSASDAVKPIVGVIMGSSSDWDVMQHAFNMLNDFGIACETLVISAHRMPQDMAEYGAAAADRGLRAIIAGAGGAAHLPGMMAAYKYIYLLVEGVVRPDPLTGVLQKLSDRRGHQWRHQYSPQCQGSGPRDGVFCDQRWGD